MKIKLLKFILTLTMFFVMPGIFLLANTKVQAAVSCGNAATFEILSVTAEQYVDINGENNVPKVMPGDNIRVTVKNNCDTNNIKYDIYVHPTYNSDGTILDPDSTNIDQYQKVWSTVLLPTKYHMENIPIEGTNPGDYKIRVVAFQIGLTGEPALKQLGVLTRSLVIASDGINISGSSSIKKNETGSYTIKFTENKAAKFSIYIDDTSIDNRKVADVTIANDNFTYSGFSWDTSGTSVGGHKIIVRLDNNRSAEFSVTVTDPADVNDGGSTGTAGSTFSLSKLNSFNIKNLLNSDKCTSKTDLDKITCMVEVVIDWLLDIGAVISFIMILYASIIYLTSSGDESKAELAKKTLIWSVIGVIVIGAAMGVMKIIENLLNNPSSLS